MSFTRVSFPKSISKLHRESFSVFEYVNQCFSFILSGSRVTRICGLLFKQ